MDGLPLHPAIVHIPLGLAFLAPIAAIGVAWSLKKDWLPRRAWLSIVGLFAAIFVSGWITIETGENEEEKVERIVGEAALEAHEEKAEAFVWAAGIAMAVAGFGLFPANRGAGRWAPAATVVASFIVLGLAIATGHAGGRLVYVHGAAGAYTSATAAGAAITEAVEDRD